MAEKKLSQFSRNALFSHKKFPKTKKMTENF